MQKTKRVILSCLIREPANRFQLRKNFSKISKPTNSSELMRQLAVLESQGCVTNTKGTYRLTKKGENLYSLLTQVHNILKQ